jgi:hypothetical protein
MNKEKYLWSSISDQSNLPLHIYLNENGEQIYGNIVSESNIINPFLELNNCNKAQCKGVAKTFISIFNNNVGLTDINHTQYQKLHEFWNQLK